MHIIPASQAASKREQSRKRTLQSLGWPRRHQLPGLSPVYNRLFSCKGLNKILKVCQFTYSTRNYITTMYYLAELRNTEGKTAPNSLRVGKKDQIEHGNQQVIKKIDKRVSGFPPSEHPTQSRFPSTSIRSSSCVIFFNNESFIYLIT